MASCCAASLSLQADAAVQTCAEGHCETRAAVKKEVHKVQLNHSWSQWEHGALMSSIRVCCE